MTLDDQIRRQISSDVRNAVRALANAAAIADAGEFTDSGHQLWFLVRALCHEHGLDVVAIQARSRKIAAERLERAHTR